LAYEIRVSDDGAYIVLKVTGATGRTGLAQVVEAHALGAKLGIRRYLVDLTEATNPDPPSQSYEFAYGDFPATPGIDRFASVAALVSPGDHSHDFLVIVFQNSGSAIGLFDDREAALRHLLASHPPAPRDPSGSSSLI
jgi:hypothetical protein